MYMTDTRAMTALGLALLLAACSGAERRAGTDTTGAQAATAPAAPAGGPATPAPGGKVITIQLISDEKGNYFKPNDIEAKRGDVLRYTLVSGVHNVDFLPDSNPGASGLPKASDMLQLPGQTFDVPVTFAKGHYYFQCDPHALLGMKGKLEVED
ncbi:MAG TPA: plastocyanin/azurin family copper-binding protein [Gemmatimonadaceae bacterium]|nr:plastocyanin/azurin family copper-binding protein [Gemmatimonadaceae bacterium]